MTCTRAPLVLVDLENGVFRRRFQFLEVEESFHSCDSQHDAGAWIWKRRFISTVRPTVHTNLSRKRSFLKTLFKPKEFENAAKISTNGETEN